jgi:hypothetical protein
MVKIRYSELSAGLHVSAESNGRHTVIYLQPGLTPAQRRAALIRVRSGARMGHGPRLSAAGMVLAVGADRLRTTVRNGAAAMRGHPLLLLPPLIVLVSGAIVFVLMSFVTLTVPQRGHFVAAPPAFAPRSATHHGGPAGKTGPAAIPGALDRDPPAPGTGGKAGPGPTRTTTSAPPPAGSHSPVPVLSGSPPTGSPSPTPAPSPDPAPTPSASASGTCLQIGPLGLCLNL